MSTCDRNEDGGISWEYVVWSRSDLDWVDADCEGDGDGDSMDGETIANLDVAE